MRLLCLVVSSETTGFTRLLQKLRAKLRVNWASFCTVYVIGYEEIRLSWTIFSVTFSTFRTLTIAELL